MRWASLAVSVCLLAAACSGGESSQPPASSSASDTETSPVPPPSTNTTASTTTTLRPPTPTDPPELKIPVIGDLEIPCRSADLVSIGTRPGVDDDAITIGTGTDRGGIATPGSGRGVVEMIQVLADHCNALGGILGRDIRVEEYDAAAVEAGDRVTEACTEVAALVGTVFLQVIESAFTALSCALPLYRAGQDLMPSSPFPLHGHLAALFADPANAATVVLVGPDTPSAIVDQADRRAAIDTAAGPLNVVGGIVYPIDTVPDWGQIVGEARASGAGQVYLVGGCAHAVAPFLEVANTVGWEPMVVTTAAAYEDTCFGVANPARLLVEIPFLPFEDGEAAPAAAAHAVLLDRVGAPRTGNSLLAASAFWRWATAAPTCLTDPDAGCFSAYAAEQAGWTAGGLHLAIEADGVADGCAIVLGIEDGAFVRRLPAEPGTYDCTPEWSVVLPAPAG